MFDILKFETLKLWNLKLWILNDRYLKLWINNVWILFSVTDWFVNNLFVWIIYLKIIKNYVSKFCKFFTRNKKYPVIALLISIDSNNISSIDFLTSHDINFGMFNKMSKQNVYCIIPRPGGAICEAARHY